MVGGTGMRRRCETVRPCPAKTASVSDGGRACGYVNRMEDHEKGLPALATVLLCPLFHLLSRSREYWVRIPDDEQGSGAQFLRIWARCRGVLLGLFLLEVPSNLILDRVGARRWIARTMVTWGLVSG